MKISVVTIIVIRVPIAGKMINLVIKRIAKQ